LGAFLQNIMGKIPDFKHVFSPENAMYYALSHIDLMSLYKYFSLLEENFVPISQKYAAFQDMDWKNAFWGRSVMAFILI
jgi:hypothetical protein